MLNAAIALTSSQIALIRRTLAKDTSDSEFDLYLELCRTRGLNPLLRHTFATVYHKDDARRRQMVIVVSREGQRSLAERTGSYRPDDLPPRYVYSEDEKDPLANPLGLVSAEVSVFKHTHGEWFRVTEIAFWSEFAPLKEIYENDRPTGKYRLDPKKDAWKRMPRLMLAKVSEMGALRRAFPDSFGGLYGEEEMDRNDVLDLTPSEIVEKDSKDKLAQKLGIGNTLTIDWMNGEALQVVPVGKFYDAALAFFRTCEDDTAKLRMWRDRNQHALKEFFALDKNAALDLKAKREELESRKIVEIQVDEPVVEKKPAETKAAAPSAKPKAGPLPKLQLREEYQE